MRKLSLKQGSNKIRLLTNPYQIKCHFHNRSINKVIFDLKFINNICEYCIQNNDQQKLLPSKYFVFGAQDLDNNEDILLLLGGAQFRILQNLAKNPDFGDPRKFDIDFFMSSSPETHWIKALRTHEKIEKFDEIEKECIEFCKPYTMKDCINTKKDRQEFKNFFLKCKNYSNDLIEEMIPVVETDFPEHVDVLKTLLIFS